MKKLLKPFLLLVLMALGATLLHAQPIVIPRGTIMHGGRNFEIPTKEIKGVVIDSLTSETLPSAVVSLVFTTNAMSGSNNITVQNFTSNEKGEFSAKLPIYASQARLEISYIGYKLKTIYLDTDQRDRSAILLGKIRLSEDPEEVDKIVVRARLEMFKMKGDTMVFFPAAVKTMQGDAAIEILRAMPGVNVLDDGNIVVGQDTVQRTYVNNRLIFGDDPRMAFKHIEADKVQQILAYDEVDEDSAVLLGEENADKRKVMNVLTFEKFDTSITGAVSAGGGADFNKDEDKIRGRYMALAEGNVFNEKHRMTFSGGIRNSQRVGTSDDFYYAIGPREAMGFVSGSSGYQRYINANLGYAFTSENKKTKLNTNYSFNNNKSRSSSNTITEYFAKQGEFDTRVLYDTTRSESLSGRHSLNSTFHYSDHVDKKIMSVVGVNISYSNNDNNSYNGTHNIMDGTPLMYRGTTGDGSSDNMTVSLSGNFAKRWKISAVDLRAYLHNTAGEGDEIVRTTDYITGITTITRKDNDSDSFMVSSDVGFNITPPKVGNIRLSYGLNYDKSKTNVLAINEDGSIEPTLSTDKTTNNLDNQFSLSYNYWIGKHSIGASVDYNNISMINDDKFSGAGRIERTFNTVSPNFRYSFRSEGKSFGFSGSYNQSTPSLEMFTDRLTVSDNKMSLSAGNSKLKRSGMGNINANFDITTKSSTSFGIGLGMSVYDNQIIGKQEFFTDSTYLEQYDYIAPKGASFNTYINGDGYESYNAYASFSTNVKPIKSTLRLSANYSHSNPQSGVVISEPNPAYDPDAPESPIDNPKTIGKQIIVRSERDGGSFSVGLQSNFSSQIRISLNSNTSYYVTSNYNGVKDRQISERLSTEVKWDLLSRFNITAYYAYNYSRNSTNKSMEQNDHILNASIRCRIFKNRRGAISFNAYDILNNQSNYYSNVDVEYIRTTWRKSYSSYFTINFEYRFNMTK